MPLTFRIQSPSKEASNQDSGLEHISSIIDRVLEPYKCPYCPGIARGTVTGAVYPLSCKRWCCYVCGPRNARRFVKRASQHPYNWMLNIHAGWDVSPENCRLQSRCFRRLLALMRKEIPGIGDLDAYSYGNERGPNGGHKLHRHIWFYSPLNWIPYHKMLELAQRAGFRSRRPIRLERSNGAVGYGAKVSYAVKQGEEHWPRYQRRTYTSLPPLPKPEGFEPCEFIRIDELSPALREERVAELTGEVVTVYSGPSYLSAIQPYLNGSSAQPFLIASGRVEQNGAKTLALWMPGPAYANADSFAGSACASASLLSLSSRETPPSVSVSVDKEGIK